MSMNPNEAGQSSSRLRWLVVGVGVALVILILILAWFVFSPPPFKPTLLPAIPPICASIRARIANDTARRTGANARELSALNQDMTAVTMQAKSHGCP